MQIPKMMIVTENRVRYCWAIKTVPNLSAYVNKKNLLDVTAWFFIQTRKITSNATNAPKHTPLEKLIPTRCGIRLPFGITNGERVMC